MNASFQGTIKVGDRLNDYSSYDVEVKRIAGGGFGLVYMGPCRLHDGEWRALKTLRPDVLARSQRASDLFVREGLTWVGLWPHPNLLTAHTVTTINGQPFLALDYAEYGSLRSIFASARMKGDWLSSSLALYFAQQIAAGLVALHTPNPDFLRPNPLVHRDLKPENILITVTEQPYARITDFGLAKVAEEIGAEDPLLLGYASDQSALSIKGTSGMLQDTLPDLAKHNMENIRSQVVRTAHGVALGTYAYMAPEQWDDAASAGPPADVYAFGLTLAELVTGRHSLLGLDTPHSQAEWQVAHKEGAPRSLATLAAQEIPTNLKAETSALGAEVEEVYQACLAKRAEARPTAAALVARLQQAAQRLDVTPYTLQNNYPHTVENEQIKWHSWGITYLSFHLYDEALIRNDRALALAPTDPDALITRGNILATLRRPEDALSAYEKAMEVLPLDDVRRMGVWNNRGLRFNELAFYEQAEAAYAQALAIQPEAATTWHNRAKNRQDWANTETELGNAEMALAHEQAGVGYAERAVALNPHNPDYSGLLNVLRNMLRAAEGR
ncbi:MAG TPA: serine/threonine-protein kinase [Ktedonobacterales bacterium]|nr:serine/threonine-protein kinase [Ktedonobacterales bacterium]